MQNLKFSKYFPFIIISSMVVLFTVSYIAGSQIVSKSEKELSSKRQIREVKSGEYTLEEIDAKTGELRWRLKAKEGITENNLQNALVKDISVEVYKKNDVIFELKAPYGKANYLTKDIYLFGKVSAKDKENNLLLISNKISLGMGTSIEAKEGFTLTLKNTGTIRGENALINDDQTKILITNLDEASLKEIKLSGKEVYIEKTKNGELKKAKVTNGGKIILIDKINKSLSANTIMWEKDSNIEAVGDVTFNTEDKVLKANYLILKPGNKFYAKNNVQIIHGDTKCFGSYLNYEGGDLIALSGSPKAIQQDKQISADKIVYDTKNGKVEAIGNVKTIVKTQID